MELDVKRVDHIVPEYSLTGDLLSYSRCHLQYRYYNGSSLPPSRPVQLWYGEFIHGMMEAAFRLWSSGNGAPAFPWPYTPIAQDGPRDPPPAGLPAHDIRMIGWPIEQTLSQEGKQARSRHARRAAYRRAERAVNMLGPHLFPLISMAEQRVLGTRALLSHDPAVEPRSSRYALRGVIDVLGDIDLDAPPGNVFRDALRSACPDLDGEFEIIVDYKGAHRPLRGDEHWNLGAWQVQTYAWLRERQPDAKRVAAGILIYVNELAPSPADVARMRREINAGTTDIRPQEGSRDDYQIQAWTPGTEASLSEEFRLRRALRIIPVTAESTAEATRAFDRLVAEIEDSVRREAELGSIGQAWSPDGLRDRDTCSACDFLSFCPRPADGANPSDDVGDDEFS
ncbi:PD-(D/E)XK nuclease family protein [Inquilinus limosus]|uniref:hypothetical protein n=1 Tax=Inquilinus limosus TaxID=171674 RepID=UPI003F13CB1A